MSNSAIARRSATADRISAHAQVLTDTGGLDGFTMDDLAVAADVSRRTLFNYFPSKIDAVLGTWPTFGDDDVARFRDGGPHGDLLRDLREMLMPLLETKLEDREALARSRRILLHEERLMAAVHRRYTDLSCELVEHIAAREGATFHTVRARVAVGLLAALFDTALDEYLLDAEERPFLHHFDESLRTARTVLGA
ncbi:TetR/AcrR family transcriptional regulator [Nocardioides sp.]|uniref:TetR/AcrR family transcriptional regulator n=1 Tax=Nocardioides sp. TaxID=35761 RepID=UPI003518EB14